MGVKVDVRKKKTKRRLPFLNARFGPNNIAGREELLLWNQIAETGASESGSLDCELTVQTRGAGRAVVMIEANFAPARPVVHPTYKGILILKSIQRYDPVTHLCTGPSVLSLKGGDVTC
eukprot:284816170_5